MPNHKLSSAARDEIINGARALTRRRLDYATAGFPLNTATIQLAVMPADQLSLLRQLRASGYKEAPKTNNVAVAIIRDDYPGLERGLPVSLHLPQEIYEPSQSYMRAQDTEFDPTRLNFLHKLTLNDDERAEVVKWANAVVRVMRMREIADSTVRLVMDMCKSTAEVLAAWPLLATLVKSDEWRTRFRHPPRNIKRWAPDFGVANPVQMRDWDQRVAASDIVLNGAALLEPYKPEPGLVVAKVESWERLPKDRRYSRL